MTIHARVNKEQDHGKSILKFRKKFLFELRPVIKEKGLEITWEYEISPALQSEFESWMESCNLEFHDIWWDIFPVKYDLGIDRRDDGSLYVYPFWITEHGKPESFIPQPEYTNEQYYRDHLD